MTLDRLVLWMVGFSCVMFLLRSLSMRPRQWGWTTVALGILAVTAGLYGRSPQWAAWVGGALWTVLLLLPVMGLRRANALLRREEYGAASRWATAIALLHPADGWRDRVGLLRALAVAKRGDFEEALARLKPYQQRTTALGLNATALGFWLRGDWSGLLEWVRSRPERHLDFSLANSYLRALGETGQLNELVRVFPAVARAMQKAGDGERLHQARLYLLAFAGETELLYHLFDRDLVDDSPTSQQFWIATAQLAIGRSQTGRKMLEILQQQGDPLLNRAIAWRLKSSKSPRNLDATATTRLARIKRGIVEDLRYTGRDRHATPVATWGLIGLNGAMFFLELRAGGSNNLWVLYRLGALVPEDVLAGDWWRLVTATFLHFGVAHLLMNMFGLYVLGQFVEPRLGFGRFLATYFASGVGSMAFITLLSRYASEQQFVVGASGAVMGLIGAIAAVFWQGWRQDKAQIAKQRLRTVGFVVLLQAVFDLSIPEICFSCHLSGAVLGFVTASLLLWNRPKSPSDV